MHFQFPRSKKFGSPGIAVVRALDKGPHFGVEVVSLTGVPKESEVFMETHKHQRRYTRWLTSGHRA